MPPILTALMILVFVAAAALSLYGLYARGQEEREIRKSLQGTQRTALKDADVSCSGPARRVMAQR